MTQRIHDFQTRTAGGTVGTEEFASALGDAASRNYVDLGVEGFGASGDIAAAFGQTSAGAETSLSTSVNETSPGTAGLALTFAFRLLFKRTNGAALELVAPRNSTGKVASLLVNVGRTFLVRAGGAGTTPTTDTNIGTASAGATVGIWYDVTYAVQAGTTTSNGKVYVKVATTTGGTVLYEVESTTSNLALTNIVSANLGKPVANTGTLIFDGMISENAYNKTLTPFVASNVPPTVDAGTDQTVEPFATVTLTVSATDTDGTIASYACAQTSGTPIVTLSGTGASRTFTAPPTLEGTNLTFTWTATDDDGATGTDSSVISVTPHNVWYKNSSDGTLHGVETLR